MKTSNADRDISISLVVVPEVAAGVLYSLHEVLSFVGSGWEFLTGWSPGRLRFVPQLVGSNCSAFRNPAGLPIVPEASFADVHQTDIVIVPDLVVARDEDTHGRWPEAIAWIKEQHAGGALVCSVCTGSLLLAESDLLDGVEATCHWAIADLIRDNYPRVELRPERVLVAGGPEHRLITAGASASWSDLVLYLVARYGGEEEARRTAKLFLFGDRSDGQLPFAARVRPRQHDDAAIAQAQLWIAENYATANPVSEMTRISGLTPRTFKRRFETATGYAPLDYVQSLRIEEAKQMLEASDKAIDDIAEDVGYVEPAAFRRLFKRATGLSPLQYRQRFQQLAPAG